LIQHLKSKGVEFLTTPKIIKNTCNNEWKDYGSCCSREKLSTLNKSHRNAVFQMLKDSSDKTSNMEIFSRLFMSIIRTSLLTIRRLINSSRTIAKEQKAELIDEITNIRKDYLEKLDETYKWISNNFRANLKSQRHCVRVIWSLRSSSVCYACSARASIFFTKGKLNMHENDCRNTINECSEAWLNLLNYITHVSEFHKQVVDISKLFNIDFSKFMASDPSSDVADWSKQINLANELLGCKDGLCSFESSKKICDAMISFEQPYYIERILNIIGKDSEGLVSFKSIEEQQAFINRIVQEFEQTPLEQLIKKILSIRKARLANTSNANAQNSDGRSLRKWKLNNRSSNEVPSPPPAVETPPTPQQQPQSVEAPTPVPAEQLQETTVNPLLCPVGGICVADKIVLSASECDLYAIRCTSPLFMFP